MDMQSDSEDGCDAVGPHTYPSLSTRSIGSKLTQWATGDDVSFSAIGRAVSELPPSAYNLIVDNGIIHFSKFDLNIDDLLTLPNSLTHEIVSEISNFWDLYDYYKKYNISHRRGILISGPAGCGKSCILKLVAADVIKRGGIVIPYTDPSILIGGINTIRSVQPTTPIVVLMEDLESILSTSKSGQSMFLNLLDGVYSDSFDRVVFMATTNYPEQLEKRITNRPSRFDRVFVVENPTPDARLAYLKYIVGDNINIGVTLSQIVCDTDNLSFAHLKEIFVSTVIMGNSYKKVLEAVRKMSDTSLPSGHSLEKGRRGIGYK